MEALDLAIAVAGVGGGFVVADLEGGQKECGGACEFGAIISAYGGGDAEGSDNGVAYGSGDGGSCAVRYEAQDTELAEAADRRE